MSILLLLVVVVTFPRLWYSNIAECGEALWMVSLYIGSAVSINRKFERAGSTCPYWCSRLVLSDGRDHTTFYRILFSPRFSGASCQESQYARVPYCRPVQEQPITAICVIQTAAVLPLSCLTGFYVDENADMLS